jgi:repressor LexA
MLTSPPKRKRTGNLTFRTARKTQEMTDRIFRFIVAFQAQHGYPPTVTEIGAAVYMSRSGVVRHLDRLVQQGKIIREPGKARGITILMPP